MWEIGLIYLPCVYILLIFILYFYLVLPTKKVFCLQSMYHDSVYFQLSGKGK